jgi:hypothetical protein
MANNPKPGACRADAFERPYVWPGRNYARINPDEASSARTSGHDRVRGRLWAHVGPQSANPCHVARAARRLTSHKGKAAQRPPLVVSKRQVQAARPFISTDHAPSDERLRLSSRLDGSGRGTPPLLE